MRAAVVGAGPAGFYTAQALARRFPDAKIDILDALPVPFGLVRYGVAPDHPATKHVTETFSTFIRATPNVTFLGNVPISPQTALSPSLLTTLYNLTIHATGAATPRTLALPAPPFVHTAHSFISWLNGHPHHTDPAWDHLSNARRVGIIGMGNVSLDVARLLLRPVADLRDTDVSPRALQVLEEARVKEVCVYGRRAPKDAAWTSAALREVVGKVPGVVTGVDKALVERDAGLGLPRGKARMLKLLAERAVEDGVACGERLLRLRFLYTPVGFVERGAGVAVEMACGVGGRDAVLEELDVVFQSLGYEAGTGEGYRVGWANGKARGIIGDNKWDAEAVVEGIPDGVGGGEVCRGLADWLVEEGMEFTTWEGWERIDEEERRRGVMAGRRNARVKIEDIGEMLEIARGPAPMVESKKEGKVVEATATQGR